jgi:hypothetical protein
MDKYHKQVQYSQQGLVISTLPVAVPAVGCDDIMQVPTRQRGASMQYKAMAGQQLGAECAVGSSLPDVSCFTACLWLYCDIMIISS